MKAVALSIYGFKTEHKFPLPRKQDDGNMLIKQTRYREDFGIVRVRIPL